MNKVISPNPDDVKAVFFDFDGTLIDSYPAITASVNYIRGIHDLPPLGEPEVRRFVGRGAIYLLENTVPGADPHLSLEQYRDHHPGVMETLTRLLPGSKDLIPALHKSGRKIGLVSNKPKKFSQGLIPFLGWDKYFDVVLAPEDVPNPKPAPDMLLEAIKRTNVPSEQSLYVGDMIVDIDTGRKAGVPVWVVPTGSEKREDLEKANPDYLLSDLHEMRLLMKLD